MPPPPLTVQYKEANGSKITTDIYLPPAPTTTTTENDTPKKYPVCTSNPSTTLYITLLKNFTVINIHGGVFMLGHSRMVSMPQVDDCLTRNWIVVVPNHRLCPQVNMLEGPITDIRDLLAWIYDGQLDAFLAGAGADAALYRIDMDRVMAFGTSSGGTLALSLVSSLLPFSYYTHIQKC